MDTSQSTKELIEEMQKTGLYLDLLNRLCVEASQLPKPKAPDYFRAGESAASVLKHALKASAVGSETVQFGPSTQMAAHIIGSAAYMLGGIAESVVSISDLEKAEDLHSHNKLAFASAATHFSLSQVVTGAGLLTLLAHTGALGPIAMAAVTPIAPFAYAAIAWTKAIRSIVELAHEAKKLNDNEYFKNDTEKKLESVNNKLEILLGVDKKALTGDKQDRLKVKIEKLTREQEELSARLMLLSEPNLNEDKQKLYNALIDTQREKVYAKATAATSTVMLATGFTMIAAATLGGPAAPLIAGLGIGIVAVGGAIKLFKLGYDKIISGAVNKEIEKECKAACENDKSLEMGEELKRQKINEKVCKIIGLQPENAEHMKMVAALPKKDALKILARDHKKQLNVDAKMKVNIFKSNMFGLFKSRHKRPDVVDTKEVSFKASK